MILLKDKLQNMKAKHNMEERSRRIQMFRTREKQHIENAVETIKTMKDKCLAAANAGNNKVSCFYQYQTNGTFKYPSGEPRSDYSEAFRLITDAIKNEDLSYSIQNICESTACINIYW